MTLRISVIIPTLNEEHYIEPFLKQLHACPFVHEIIISDGNSADKTVTIAKKYTNLITVYKGNTRQTIAHARNMGAKLASGDILFHTDADVRIPKINSFLKIILRYFEKDKHLLGISPRIIIDPKEVTTQDKIMQYVFDIITIVSWWIHLPVARGECNIVRKSAFDAIKGYNNLIVVGEDHDLFYRLQTKGKIKRLKNLNIYHSPRRYHKYGYFRCFVLYIREAFAILFLKKSTIKEWPDPK